MAGSVTLAGGDSFSLFKQLDSPTQKEMAENEMHKYLFELQVLELFTRSEDIPTVKNKETKLKDM